MLSCRAEKAPGIATLIPAAAGKKKLREESDMPVITHLTPDDLTSGVFSDFERIVLAQGDSWFSIGAIPPFATSNLIFNMQLSRKTCVVDCARPGATLVNMVDWMDRDAFGNQLV